MEEKEKESDEKKGKYEEEIEEEIPRIMMSEVGAIQTKKK